MATKEGSPYSRRVAVVGAGVVGIASAIELMRKGCEVMVFDRLGPGEACSFGNSGAMPTYHAIPIGTPGILVHIPRYLFDPLGPLSLRWRHFPALVPWLAHFVRSTSESHFQSNLAALVGLARLGHEAWTRVLSESGTGDLVRESASITLYRTEKARENSRPLWSRLQALGARAHFLSEAELEETEPCLPVGYRYAVLDPDYRYTVDPHRLVQGLASFLSRSGGRIVRADVAEFVFRDGKPSALRTSVGEFDFDACVIAAGVESNVLLRQFGAKAPLEAARGYHMTFDGLSAFPGNVLLISDMRMSLTPMARGLRLGGTLEFSGQYSGPNFLRAENQLRNLKKLYPGVDFSRYSKWSGNRPMTPDSLPVIDRCREHPNIVYAFGHGQYGLTLAAVTGDIVADLVGGREPSVDMAPFRFDRW